MGPADTIDFYNNSTTTAATGTPWGADYLCSGIDATGTSNSVWKDVTTNGCSGTECRYKDQINQLEWTGRVTTTFWSDAIRACKDLTYDGKSDWRLPTHHEALDAYRHGIYTATSANWITKTQIKSNDSVWTSTKKRSSAPEAWIVNLSDGNNVAKNLSEDRHVHCVRKDGEDY